MGQGFGAGELGGRPLAVDLEQRADADARRHGAEGHGTAPPHYELADVGQRDRLVSQQVAHHPPSEGQLVALDRQQLGPVRAQAHVGAVGAVPIGGRRVVDDLGDRGDVGGDPPVRIGGLSRDRPDRGHQRGPEGAGAAGDEVVVGQAGQNAAGGRLLLDRGEEGGMDGRAVGVDDLHVAVDEAHVGVGVQQLRMAAQPVQRPDVVGVQQGDVLAAHRAQAGVDRLDEAAVLLADHLDAIGISGEHVGGVVRGAVVHDDDLNGTARRLLGERGVQCLGQVPGEVVGGDDHRHARPGGHVCVVGAIGHGLR